MLVCNVSLRPQRSAIAADLAEAAAAADLVTFSIGYAVLLDEPVSASDTLSAFVGQFMVEAANASDTLNAGLIYAVQVDEPAAAGDVLDAIGGAAASEMSESTTADSVQDATLVASAHVVEAATAIDDPSADVVAAPGDEWTLVDSWTRTVNVPQVDFIGLAGYSEVRVVLDGVALSAAGFRYLFVSTDNGSTFLNTSGDYIDISSAGVETPSAQLVVASSSTTARSSETIISGWNLTTIKHAERRYATDFNLVLIPTTSALNALRIKSSAAGNLTAGSIYVFAR